MTTLAREIQIYKRGDIVLCRFPDSNLLSTTARPVLIIQTDNLQTDLPQVIVAMITSKIFRSNHPSRVPILRSTSDGKRSGLLRNSVVMTDNLATVAESTIDRVIGSIPMTKIDHALRHTLNL